MPLVEGKLIAKCASTYHKLTFAPDLRKKSITHFKSAVTDHITLSVEAINV
jgi:hypothetical protein